MPKSSPFPDFFIVGAQRSGTTALYEYLGQHTAVFMSPHKETHYFSQDRVRLDADLGIRTESAYLNLFSRAPAASVCGEASPSYLWHPTVARRIHDRQPNAKIIAILRNPIARAFSQYQMDLGDGLPAIPFYDLIVQEFEHGEKVYGTGHLYVELGMYGAQLKNYLNVFGPEDVLVLATDDLRVHTVNVLKRVATFLGIDPEPFGRVDASKVYNRTGLPRTALLRRALPHRFLRQAYRRLMPLRVRRILRGQLFESRPPPEIDTRAIEFLRALYEPDLVELEKQCAISFPEFSESEM